LRPSKAREEADGDGAPVVAPLSRLYSGFRVSGFGFRVSGGKVNGECLLFRVQGFSEPTVNSPLPRAPHTGKLDSKQLKARRQN